MEVLYTYHSGWGHRQGWGGRQPREVDLGQPPTTCLSHQGQHPAACKQANLPLWATCKDSSAKPHCNTRSHRLRGLTSLARYKHTEHCDTYHRHFHDPWLGKFMSLKNLSLSFLSQAHQGQSSDYVSMTKSADNTSANPLVKSRYYLKKDAVML